MKNIFCLILLVAISSCKTNKPNDKPIIETNKKTATNHFTIAFGSCNNQNLPNKIWGAVLKNSPNLWIWGGDIIYADTENMSLMQSYYDQVKNDKNYKMVASKMDILGTWDDHDYGKNDAGVEFVKKDSAQQLFLNFINVKKDDIRRHRKGVYHSKTYKIADKAIKVILLDTRYSRTTLTKDPTKKKRYIPAKDSIGSILGITQWEWLTNELNNSKADFNILVSSIQFLSAEHGFETWGNMPNEVDKLKRLIVTSNASNAIILSGDRHISEVSKTEVDGLSYPLYDFTSSGLTHTYTGLTNEPNKYRISRVINEKNFGLLHFNISSKQVSMEIRSENNALLEQIIQKY